MPEPRPLVGVIMGSQSDWDTLRHADEVLAEFGVARECRVVSAHRTPELMAEYARTAVERGCGRMEWSVLNWNEPAIGFYRALGAEPMDEWTVYRLAGDALRAVAGA